MLDLATKLYADYAFAQHGVTSVGLRYFNVFGPRQRADSAYAAAIPKFIANCRAGVPPQIFGTGEQTRDFVHVSDVVRANLLAGIQPNLRAEVLNVGTGIATSVQALAEETCRLTNPNLAPVRAEARPGDIARSVCDPRQAEHVLHWRARVSFTEGLAQLIQARE